MSGFGLAERQAAGLERIRAIRARSTYRSGWCSTDSHDRCRGQYAGADCTCTCHHTCPACGQTLPEGRRG